MKKIAICLCSGGLDSTTVLYSAVKQGYDVRLLAIAYGQRHQKELRCAESIAAGLRVPLKVMDLPLGWKGSSLLDTAMALPTGRSEEEMSEGIPSSYVPGRNIMFLSLAASYAEAIGAETIFIGANALDYSGYPDCRPEFFEAFETCLKVGTKAGTEGRAVKISVPLLNLSKKEIVELGKSLGVPFEMTWSCYEGREKPCGQCDSCRLREKGFREAGISDPLVEHAASRH